MAGSVFYALRAHRAQQNEAQARQEAQEATAQAERSLERADAVNAFLVQDVIGGADPFKMGQAALSLQEALDRAEKNIATRFKGQPEAEAQVRIMLAQAYSGRGEHALARDQYTQAVEAIEAAPAADQALAVQARLHKAGSLLNLGDFEGFDSTMAPALKAVDSDPTLDPKLRVHVNFVSGQKAMLAGDMPAAVARLEKAEMALKAVQDPNPALGLRVRSVLGMIYTQAGRHAQALKLLRAVVAEATEEYGVAHPETLNARILLGMALNGARRFDEAAQSLAATRRDAIATHGADSEPVLDADQLLAAAQIGRGKLQEGAELYASAYARREQRAGISNPQTLDLAAATADALRRVGRGAQALSLLDKAREAAAAIPLQARAAIVQKLDYVKACALVAEGRSLPAAQIADTLQPTVLATAAPQDDWPQRLQVLHQALRVGVDTKVDPCPIFGVRG
jgi:tetratricopeptide (TPR) repeat protein